MYILYIYARPTDRNAMHRNYIVDVTRVTRAKSHKNYMLCGTPIYLLF